MIAIVALAASCMASCEGERHQRTTDAEDGLFRESVSLMKRYTDSLAQAPDTLVDQLLERYTDESSRLNNSYPPLTDEYMSESRNDTLRQMHRIMLETAEKRLHPAVAADTLRADSLPDGAGADGQSMRSR